MSKKAACSLEGRLRGSGNRNFSNLLSCRFWGTMEIGFPLICSFLCQWADRWTGMYPPQILKYVYKGFRKGSFPVLFGDSRDCNWHSLDINQRALSLSYCHILITESQDGVIIGLLDIIGQDGVI